MNILIRYYYTMSVDIAQTYLINSRDRLPQSISTTDFWVSFDYPITNTRPDQKLGLRMANIPITYYNINSTNNTLYVTELQGGVSTQFYIQMPYGSGTPTNILTALTTQLSTASPNGLTYVIAFDTTTGKLTFSFTGTATSVTYNNTNNYFTADDLLGLYQTSDAVVPANGTFVGGIVNFNGIADALMQIRLENLPVGNIFTTETGLNTTIMLEVPISQSFAFGEIAYSPSNIDGPKLICDLAQLHFRITDTRNLTIDLNGKNVQFEMVLFN